LVTYLFQDEFDGPAGSGPDPSKWGFDTGAPGAFGNNELETYTSDLAILNYEKAMIEEARNAESA
jgi:hypothetical protein